MRYVLHDVFVRATWRIRTCDMTHSYVWHDSFIRVTHCQLQGMGWLRLVGSIKWYVSFAKEPYETDDILQERPKVLSILLTVATPHVAAIDPHPCFYMWVWPSAFACVPLLLYMSDMNWGGYVASAATQSRICFAFSRSPFLSNKCDAGGYSAICLLSFCIYVCMHMWIIEEMPLKRRILCARLLSFSRIGAMREAVLLYLGMYVGMYVCRYGWMNMYIYIYVCMYMNEPCRTCECVMCPCERVMSNMWMGPVTNVNESCHTCEWVLSRMWMSHVTHVNQSCYTCVWVLSHMWMSHVTHVNEPYHTCEWVISRMRMSHVTHVNEACHACEWVMSRMWMSHVTHLNEPCRACEWAMSRMWMRHVAHVNASCHACEWAMSHMWMSHVTHVNEPYHTCEWVISHMWMSHVTYVNESCHTCE